MAKTIWKFSSMEELVEYWKRHPEAVRAYSPGGAAGRLGCSRQRVYSLIRAGKLRAWFVYDRECGECHDVPGNRASFVFVSEEDVERYATAPKDKGGRPRKGAQEGSHAPA